LIGIGFEEAWEAVPNSQLILENIILIYKGIQIHLFKSYKKEEKNFRGSILGHLIIDFLL
jgi:hypothetical protein